MEEAGGNAPDRHTHEEDDDSAEQSELSEPHLIAQVSASRVREALIVMLDGGLQVLRERHPRLCVHM